MTKSTLRAGRGAGLVAVAAVVALAITGCTRAETPTPGETGNAGEVVASPGITDTSLSLGISVPLSGPAAAVGTCAAAGLYSYLEAGNAAGGFEFGDGKTREVNLVYLDDTYDPARAVSNFRQLIQEGIFAYAGALGTPTNAAVMPIANEEHVPQVVLQTGAGMFSADPATNPWTQALLPSYYDEAFAFGTMLVETGDPITVAILYQNDDFGDEYKRGIEDSTAGSAVEIVEESSYETTDTTLDRQVTELAATGADVLVSAVSVTPLQVGVLLKAQSLGWLPKVFVTSIGANPATVIIPGEGAAYPAIYTTAFSKTPGSPAFEGDEDVQAFQSAFETYGSEITTTFTPQCAWGYVAGSVLEEAFKLTTEPTRESFMTGLRSISNFSAPLLLDGVVVDTTEADKPAITDLQLVEFDGQGYVPMSDY